MPASANRAALWIGLATIGVWGLNFPLQKSIFRVIGPEGFLFLRYLLMPLCAAALLCWRFGRAWPALTRADWWALTRLGLLGQGLHLALATYGVHWSTAFSSSVLLACGPVFTLLILRATGVETLSRAQVAGVAVAAAGALLFMSDKLLGADGRMQWQASGGDLVLLLAAALFSYYTVASKPLIARLGGTVVMCLATLITALPVLLYSAPAAARVDWAAVSPWLWLGAVWAIVGSGFVGWLAWGHVNAQRGVARSAPLIYLMPPIAGLAAWAGMGESYGPLKLLGAAIALGGVALAQFARRAVAANPID